MVSEKNLSLVVTSFLPLSSLWLHPNVSSAHCCLKRGCRGLLKAPPPLLKPSVIVEALGIIAWCHRDLLKDLEPTAISSCNHWSSRMAHLPWL